MKIEDCYSLMGAEYSEILRRLGSEERIERFLFRFPKDESFSKLERALRENNGNEAFRAAHSLKGICMNLELTLLCNSVKSLTEELRGGNITPKVNELFEQVEKDYRYTLQIIKELQQTKN